MLTEKSIKDLELKIKEKEHKKDLKNRYFSLYFMYKYPFLHKLYKMIKSKKPIKN